MNRMKVVGPIATVCLLGLLFIWSDASVGEIVWAMVGAAVITVALTAFYLRQVRLDEEQGVDP